MNDPNIVAKIAIPKHMRRSSETQRLAWIDRIWDWEWACRGIALPLQR